MKAERVLQVLDIVALVLEKKTDKQTNEQTYELGNYWRTIDSLTGNPAPSNRKAKSGLEGLEPVADAVVAVLKKLGAKGLETAAKWIEQHQVRVIETETEVE